MRPTIVLLSPPGDHEVVVARLQGAGTYEKDAILGRVFRGDCLFGVDFTGDVLDDFSEEEVDEIRNRIGDFRAVMLEYSSVPCVRDLLLGVLQGVSGVLDTNHGEMITYGEVLERFRADPLWDWRSVIPE
ncbi:hypothetical protein [Streptomyces sp. NPDC059631]|uniref:hypothetical protein n=1 Tax=unclassified Streptomyces TaxID=2593676 RepID=UPI003691430A